MTSGMSLFVSLHRLGLAVTFFALLVSSSEAQLRIATYNTLDSPLTVDTNPNFDSDLELILDAIANNSVNGIAKRLDILTLQEQTFFSTFTTASNIADQLNLLHGVSSYTSILSGFGADRVGFVYDTSTIDLIATTVIPISGSRPAFRMQFRPVGYTSDDADVYLYSTHFQAGSAVGTRTDQGNFLSNNADSLGQGENILLTGDFNFGTSSEQGYQNLLGAGDGQVFDPLELGSWPNSAFAIHMTQSTRTTSFGGGANGGMDDRFDLQLVSGELLDGEGISYIGPSSAGGSGLAHSHQAFGNDGVSYNQAINNTYAGRSQTAAVLDALHDFSDHLPVVADYQLPAVMDASFTSVIPSIANLNEVITLDMFVENVADVIATAGADELDYTLTATGNGILGFLGDAFGSDPALNGGVAHSAILDTTSLGVKTGSIVFESTSLAAENSLIEIPYSFEVIDPVIPGDYDNDGFVAQGDLNLVLLNWGASSTPPGWINEPVVDGQISQNELNGVLLNWGNGTPPLAATSIVPEPTGVALVLGGLLFLPLRRDLRI